jgi:hypothetical protein
MVEKLPHLQGERVNSSEERAYRREADHSPQFISKAKSA